MKHIASDRKASGWLVLLLAIALLQGCGKSAGDGLVGAWEIDRESMSEQAKKQLAAADNPMEIGMARMAMAMIDDMRWTISLRDDGALSLSMEESGYRLESAGTWSAEGDRVTMKYSDERDRPATLAGTVQGKRIHLEPMNDGQPGVILVRVGPPLAAVVEEPEQIPPLGPLRKDCPPKLAGASPASGGNVDDIVGLRPGLSFDDTLALLECRDDVRVVQTAALWSAPENFGIPTRQLLRASDGIPCNEKQAARANACDTGGGRFAPLRNVTREYIVAFTGLPEEEVARVVWRRTVYGAEDKQAISVLSQALIEKYGPPQLQATGNHLRLNDVRAGATNLAWLNSREGTPMPPPSSQFSNAAMNWETCVNGLKPQFATRQSWSSGCNLTIRAEILPQPDNGLLAQELNMMVANQRDLYHGDSQFKTALRVVSDDKLRKESARPDL